MTKPSPSPEPPVSSFRFSEEERQLLRGLAASLGLSNTAVLRLAIRDLARRQLGTVRPKGARK